MVSTRSVASNLKPPASKKSNPRRKRQLSEEDEALQASEIRSKRRHHLLSSVPHSQNPDFLDAKSEKRFAEHFKSKEFLVEKPFAIDCPEIYEILQLNQLESSVSFGGSFNQSLVAEFYANIHESVTDQSSPFYHKVFVRGNWIDFSPSAINNLLGIPHIHSDFAPELERPDLSPTTVIQFLTKNLVEVWPEDSSLIPASKLTSQFSLLLKLCKSQWIPSSHLSSFNLREAMCLYLLSSDTLGVNLGCVIHENILERSVPHLQKKLIHPVLISRLLHKQSVPFRPSDILSPVPAPIGSNKRLTQGNRINDLPSSSGSSRIPLSLKDKIIQSIIDCQVECHKLQYRLDAILLQLTEIGLPSVPE